MTESLTENEPIWLSESDLLAIHSRQIARYGGAAGTRDEGLLQSAANRGRNKLYYASAALDFYDLAAAYAFGVIKNHPFIDGNKRTAYAASRLFTQLNGYDIKANQEEKYLTVIQLAEGLISEEDYALWLREKGQKTD